MKNLFQTNQTLVLASASPRRKLFFQELGIAFTHASSHGIEPLPHKKESPIDYACRSASVKAHFVAKRHANAVIVGADTVVSLDNVIYGKPTDENHALTMLNALAGRGHTVISAVSLIFPHGEEVIFHDSTEVFFHAWSTEVLKSYAQCGEPMDKAGAYAIQGQGAFLVERIEGSWSTVVGLPLTLFVQKLMEYNCIGPISISS